MPKSFPYLVAPSILIVAIAGSACATDGYFDYGYGVKAKGMGGAGVAFPQDSLAPATNPAGLAFVESRVDMGITYFKPDRDAMLGGTAYEANETANFWMPEAGVGKRLGDRFGLGLAIYGNGGMNTDYQTNIPAFGTSKAGVDLSQVFAAPTVSVQVASGHAFGVSVVLAYQRFKAHGLENFGVENAGYDESHGAGVRLGYTGRLASWLSIGVTWQSRIDMSRFDRYDHLFAEHGDFDIPANYAAGVAITPIAGTTLACDVERIEYSKVAAIGHDLTMARMMAGLGSDDGPGFGWRDMNVIKLGLSQDIGHDVTARIGYNHCTQPIPADQTYFNMLAPGVVQNHATVGVSWRCSKSLELSSYIMHAFSHTVHGSGNFGGGDADLTMRQDMFGVGIGWNY